MAAFVTAFNRTIEREGGKVAHPNDPGGLTNHGISARAFPGEDIEHMTVERARALYSECFWTPLLAYNYLTQSIANEMFDTAVNCGVPQAVKWLQRSLNLLYSCHPRLNHTALAVDGGVGPRTLHALNNWCSMGPAYERQLLVLLDHYQLAHYIHLADTDARFLVFLPGWINHRINNEEV